METPVQPGQKVQLEITSYGHEGEGVGRYQNFTLFIPGALKGEAVEAKVTEIKKKLCPRQVTQDNRGDSGAKNTGMSGLS